MLERWLNITHGLELEADINEGRRGNENGVLFFFALYGSQKLPWTNY